MGRRGPRSEFYESEAWQVARKRVWNRDRATCQRCGAKRSRKRRSLHIHHIVPYAVEELRADVSNLVLLCHDCHRWVHSHKNTDKEFIRSHVPT